MRLRLVASAGADGEVPPDLDVVLQVDRRLHRLVADPRVADAARVAARPARLEGVEALERVGAQIVRRVVGADAAAIDEDARAQRMDAADVVEVGAEGEAECRCPPPTCAPPRVNASFTRIVGASNAERDSESDHLTWSRERVKTRRPSGPKCCARML